MITTQKLSDHSSNRLQGICLVAQRLKRFVAFLLACLFVLGIKRGEQPTGTNLAQRYNGFCVVSTKETQFITRSARKVTRKFLFFCEEISLCLSVASIARLFSKSAVQRIYSFIVVSYLQLIRTFHGLAFCILCTVTINKSKPKKKKQKNN